MNATVARPRAAVTIRDDDPAPVFSIDDMTVTEGNSGTKEARFTVTLTGETALPVQVEFATVDGSAKAGTDYIASAGQLVFAPGERTKTIPILINGDTTFEPDEQFVVRLSNPVDAIMARSEGTGTIVNDDTLPTLSIDDMRVQEGDSGTTEAKFTVTPFGAEQRSGGGAVCDRGRQAPGRQRLHWGVGDADLCAGQTQHGWNWWS